MSPLNSAALLFLLLLSFKNVKAQDNLDGIFQEISISSQYYPTSSVSVAKNTGDKFDLFYRGPKYQLLHAVLDSSGAILSTSDLGGILLSAPSAASPSSGKFLVSYVTLLQRVVYRTYSSSSWKAEKSAGVRSSNAPAAIVIPDSQNEIVKLYMTAVNSQLNEVEIKNGAVTGSPKRFDNVFANGAPAAVYSFDEGALVFIKNVANDVLSWSSQAGGAFTRRKDIPKLSSDMCAALLGEGGLLVAGRGFYRNIEPIFYFDNKGDRRRWREAPWISGAPGCLIGRLSCTVVVVTSGPKMLFTQYCN